MSEQPSPKKPLSKLQAYLTELKVCIGLFQEVCVAFKDLLVIITVIVFFTFGVYEALKRLTAQQRQRVEQTVSKPLDQAHK